MLKISHISKTFNPGTVNEKKALEDFSLELKKGDFATIIGSNGAGKSTFFNAVCGDFLTDSGSIILDGEDITFTPQHVRAKSIGRLYQDPMRGTAPGMTIEENLALAAGRGGWLSHTTKQEKERFREELKKLGNIIPIPFILLFIRQIFKLMKKTKVFRGLIERLENRAMGKSDQIKRYEFLGLLLFVGVPLPGTGAWTGSLIASLLEVDIKKSSIAILCGLIMATVIMYVVSYGIVGNLIH